VLASDAGCVNVSTHHIHVGVWCHQAMASPHPMSSLDKYDRGKSELEREQSSVSAQWSRVSPFVDESFEQPNAACSG
jgi:hypothetical protein